jgi:diguanylate cyclase
MLVGQYNFLLVICSLVVAILASYTALGMAERLYATKNAWWWHVGGAVAMGLGIWSMHFIGMLAYRLPIQIGYDLGLTLLSLVIAVVVSYFALSKVSSQNTTKRHVFVSAVLMGFGISAMHYTGMEAMQMFPAIQYKIDLVILSLLIAVLASGAALYIILWLRESLERSWVNRLLASILMGLAIVGMHYTGMFAAQFPADSICLTAGSGLSVNTLAILVVAGSFLILLVVNITSVFDSKTAYLIKSLEIANEQLKQQSFYDQLTQLPNRVLLEERVNQALKQAIHHKYSVVVMVIDLDGFRAINDSLGTGVGDAFLVETANRIRQTVDKQHTVSRTAGNEFVVILEQVEPRDAGVVASNVLFSIKQPLLVNNMELAITASIGLAVFPNDGDSYEELAFNADAAMQYTKRSGRNGFHYYEATMDVNAAYKLELITHLRHAIEMNELSLHYQPKFDVKTGLITGAEALLRWNHPKRGFIPPVEFIPLAEQSGLIIPIGEWVLSQACSQISEWRALGYGDINVAVNLSAVQFTYDKFYQTVVKAIEEWRIPATSLTLEITETVAMQHVEQSLEVLHKLADLGVKISIDDFGTGYSSLLYLKRFPASELKIDRGFVQLLEQQGEDEVLVSVIISLGHQFGLKIVAEGVETELQKRILTNLQCDTLQGYLLGKPKPAIEFIRDYKNHIQEGYQEKRVV